jgi:hypothetical protein
MFLGLLLTVAGFPGATQREPDNKKERQPDNKKEKPMLECRVVLLGASFEGGNTEVAILEVELKNVSGKSIDIRYNCLPPILEHMRKEVAMPDGRVVKYNCGEPLSPYSFTPLTKTIDPGKVVRVPFGKVGGNRSGVYRVQAILEYGTLKVASPFLEIELKSVN